jgi:CBS domain-containing protein
MSVGRICLRDVDLTEPNESARMAATRMRERQVGTLLVLNEAQQPIGLLTDRDLAIRVLAAGKDPERTLVHEVMTPDPEAIVEDAPIESALARMRGGSFRRLPVVTAEGRLVGIVSLDDVLALLSEEFTAIGGVLARQQPHRR